MCITGAIKDSIVGEERLVRHLLLELSQQPSFPGELHKLSWNGSFDHDLVLRMGQVHCSASFILLQRKNNESSI